MTHKICLVGTGLLFIVLLFTGCCQMQSEPLESAPTNRPTLQTPQATTAHSLVQSGPTPSSTSPSEVFVGAQLAYAVRLGRPTEIWITDFVKHTRLVQVEGDAWGLQWSPDGKYLSWAVYDNQTHQSSIWVRNTDGVIAVAVSWTEKALEYFWSPDSEMVVVREQNLDNGEHLDIYGLSVGTWQRVPVWFEDLPFDSITTFEISPDWQYIAYLQSSSLKLFIHHRDGENWSIDPPPGTYKFASLSWSPDSQWLALGVTEDEGGDTNIFVSRSNGEELRRITSGTGRRVVLNWSPSGNYVAFSLIDSEDPNQLCYIDATIIDGVSSCIKSVYAGGDLLWISDDEWLLTTNRVDEHWDIYRVSLVDKTFTSLTQGDGMESQDKGMECCLTLRPAD